MLPRELFRDSELMCHCGCGLLPEQHSVERLYLLRFKLDEVMQVSSAARCRKHNKAAGGKSGSIHLPPDLRSGDSLSWGGQGWDILGDKSKQLRIIKVALQCGYRGFGFAKTFIHIDDAKRPDPIYWTYP